MKPVDFDGRTHLLGKPPNMTDDECTSDFPVKAAVVKIEMGNVNTFESVWELSPEDLDLIIKSKRIRLCFYSNLHPPVAMSVEPEIRDKNQTELFDKDSK